MFVVGLFIGPAIGLLGGDLIARWGRYRWLGILAVALILIFILLYSRFAIGLRLGLIAGAFLGFLLAATPMVAPRSSQQS